MYLSPDRTLERRRERKKLLGVLSEKKETFPERKFVIRRGVVTELDILSNIFLIYFYLI